MGTKFVEGFFILLPVLLAYLRLGQLFDMLMHSELNNSTGNRTTRAAGGL